MRRGDLRLLLAMLAMAAAALAAPTARRRRDEHRDDAGRNGSSSAAGQAMVSFQGYKVLRVVPATERQVLDLQSYLQDHPTVDPWTEPSAPGRPCDLRVSGDEALVVREFLGEQGLVATEMIPDLGRLIDEEQRQLLDAKRAGGDFGWETYHNLEEIYRWLQSLQQKYPNDVAVVEAGRTYEGRVIQGVRIKAASENAPVALIEAGIHAREWVTPATATFLINEILTSEDAEFKAAVRAFEWHIFPSTNPDGYVYTHTTNRLWRKTRSRYNYVCQGADPNRNWPFHWREVGTSRNPCSEVYAGVRAESEPETQGLKRYIDALMQRPNPIRVYISLHSYSQLLMYPWGYTYDLPSTNDDLNEVAALAAKAASQRHGTKFKFGPIAKTIYPAAGSTIDYAYDKGIKYPFVYELRDEGTYGFMLPKEQIKPAAEETVDSISVIIREATKRSQPAPPGGRR